MVSPTLIDLNTIELRYYPFMISLDKCSGSCNVLSPKICVQMKPKNINDKAFNTIAKKKKKMKLKQWQNIFYVILNANPLVQHVNQIRNGIMKHVNVNVKIIVNAQKIVGILAHAIVRTESI